MDEENLVSEIYNSLSCKHEITREFIRALVESVKKFDQKQEVYSTNNISDSGELGLIIRIGDFLSEIKKYLSISKEKRQELGLTEEKITKDFFNIGTYGTIAYIYRQGKWK